MSRVCMGVGVFSGINLFAFSIVMLLCNGCASIASKSAWPVSITSVPSGATVTVRNKYNAEIQKVITPALITLPSGAGFLQSARYSFLFEKEGYSPETTKIFGDLNEWFFLNIPLGFVYFSPFLMAVDAASGAMWKLEPNVHMALAENKVVCQATTLKTVGVHADAVANHQTLDSSPPSLIAFSRSPIPSQAVDTVKTEPPPSQPLLIPKALPDGVKEKNEQKEDIPAPDTQRKSEISSGDTKTPAIKPTGSRPLDELLQ